MYIFYLLHKNLEYCMDNSGSGRSAICPSHIDIGLAKKFIHIPVRHRQCCQAHDPLLPASCFPRLWG